ncbi:ABC transporter ATP-binding protein [Acrocarpospora macrocephala]|uniref:ABC transporter ATP-binding protein n=1 Tax=Acrocarpospora macrocephala TaxID=150177 RepID=A0A5M3WWR4_9ACTN|nr:ABC transporter ATP-binding protein [Acrocarpospora macrocephala]GES13875.1 ABC transporter ATP-binding protein [Acrocarpospora macrocephala]
MTAERVYGDAGPGLGGSILSVRDLHAYVGQSHILQGVSFATRPAQVTAILGRNGVGKTSTLRSVLGLMNHTGVIEFDGRQISSLETHEIIRLGLAYVPEDRDVFHGLTVAENLRLAERRGLAPDYDRVFELFPELRNRRGQRAGTMSGGQQQMLSLARALLHDNRLMLVDEPTKGLAPRLVSEFVATLEQITAHTSVLLVEQNLAVARRLADHVIVLSEGRVVLDGAAEDVLADDSSIRRLLGVAADHEEG